MLCTHTDVSVWTRDIPRRGIALSLVGNNWEGKNMDKLDVHINGECFWGHDMCTQLSRKKKQGWLLSKGWWVLSTSNLWWWPCWESSNIEEANVTQVTTKVSMYCFFFSFLSAIHLMWWMGIIKYKFVSDGLASRVVVGSTWWIGRR